MTQSELVYSKRKLIQVINKSELSKEIVRVFSEEIKSLQDALEKIDEHYSEAVELITNSHKVVLSGVGKSGLIARKIGATLSSIGVSSTFLHPVEALHGDIGLVQKDDVAILLSKSGSTEEIVRLVPYLKMRQCKIISIVGNMNSFLARISDIVLDGSVEKEACPFNLAPTSSSTLAMVIGDALAMAVMKSRNTSLEDFSRLHPLGQIGRNITVKVADVMHTDKNIPFINPQASFRDALIEISNKKLGCVCVVDGNRKLLGIITDGDVRRILHKNENLQGLITESVMTQNPIRINPEAYLHEALAVMENRNSEINVLPVVADSGEVLGIIRLHDIIKGAG